ncbi:F-box/kelch-repeat protein At3g23880-like [Apium graveolens]|uniref:F-box/kelch-repeat protein At3g23880-like n=1 Tax=Apium graveolens TaxID=4045 RepID=UPI003D79B800
MMFDLVPVIFYSVISNMYLLVTYVINLMYLSTKFFSQSENENHIVCESSGNRIICESSDNRKICESSGRQTCIHDLPKDLFIEVLLRLPVKSLLRFKVVCKAWRSCISNPKFVKRHVASTTKNPNNDFFILHSRDGDQLLAINVNFPHRTISLKIPMPASDYFDCFDIIGSCNGLLCVALKCNGNELPTKLYLWNPANGKLKQISKYSIKFKPNSDDYRVSVGFGYDYTSGDYKVVRIVTYQRYFEFGVRVVIDNSIKHRVEVYSLNKDSWKEIKVDSKFRSPYWLVGGNCPIIVNGSPYWLVGRDSGSSWDLLSFNMQSEEFSTILLPGGLSSSIIEIIEFKDSVAIIESRLTVRTDIWTLDADRCFNKTIAINRLLIRSIVGCLKTGEFVGISSSNELVLYDSVNDAVIIPSQRRMDANRYYNFRSYNYSESLVNLI